MKYLSSLVLVGITFLALRPACAQTGNVGIGTNAPASKLTVNGNTSIGTGYTGTAAPANGAIIEGNVGIGTNAPTTKLDVNGQVKITDGTQGYGKVLTSDSNGVASWQPAPLGTPEVYVEALAATAQNIVGASPGFNKLIMTNEIEDIGNNYNPATSEVTIPSAGYYMVQGFVSKGASTGAISMSLTIWKNGSIAEIIHSIGTGVTDLDGVSHFAGNTVMHLNANDVLYLDLRSTAGPSVAFSNARLKVIKLFNQ